MQVFWMLLGHFWTGLKRAECCYLFAHRGVDFSNPRQVQWHQTSLCALPFEKRWGGRVAFRVKNPLEMHSTDAHYLNTPCPLSSGTTQLSSWTELLLERIHFSCFGCFHLQDIQPNLGSLSGPINLNWMSYCTCLILFRCHLGSLLHSVM